MNAQTDYYLWEVVIRPAVKRAEALEKRNGNRQGVGRSRGPFKLPTKEEYVLVGERLGIPREMSEKEYDKFLASRENGHGSEH